MARPANLASRRAIVAELLETVQRVPMGRPGGGGCSVAPQLALGMSSLLDAEQAIVYRPARTADTWRLDLFEASDDPQGSARDSTADFFSQAPYQFGPYDPARIAPAERNRPLIVDPARAPPEYHRVPIVRDLIPRIGLAGRRQARVLICDGPALLAWVGGFRDRPFKQEEMEFMRPLIAPLRARLKLEWQMAVTDAYRRTLLAAMDALEHPAYLLSASGVEHANPAGLARLEAEAANVDEIRRAAGDEGGSCFSIREPGLPSLELVTLRPSGRNLQAALDRSVSAWRLSPRQAEVLSHLAGGDTNKEIAAKLGCAEVTVEFHLRGMFSKTGAQNRSELISQFWKQ